MITREVLTFHINVFIYSFHWYYNETGFVSRLRLILTVSSMSSLSPRRRWFFGKTGDEENIYGSFTQMLRKTSVADIVSDVPLYCAVIKATKTITSLSHLELSLKSRCGCISCERRQCNDAPFWPLLETRYNSCQSFGKVRSKFKTTFLIR